MRGSRIPKLETYRTGDPQQERLRRGLEVWAGRLEANPLMTGNLLREVALAIGATEIQHKLNRVPGGWVVLDLTSAGAPVVTRTAWDTRTITLTSTAAAVANVWVF